MGKDNKDKVKVPGGGLKGAVDLLQGLDASTRQRLLKEMQEKDPTVTQLIESNLVSIDDLIHLDKNTLGALLQKVGTATLGLALRGTSAELVKFIFSNVSSNMKKDMEDILKGPQQRMQDVEEARNKVLDFVKEKVDSGEIRLSSSGDDEYV